jgi:hypothetical protein
LILFYSALLGSFRLVVCSCCSPFCPFAFKRIKVNRAEWQQQQRRHKLTDENLCSAIANNSNDAALSLFFYVSSQEFSQLKLCSSLCAPKNKITIKSLAIQLISIIEFSHSNGVRHLAPKLMAAKRFDFQKKNVQIV